MKIVTAFIVEIIGAVIYGAQHNTGSETMGPICSAFVAADIYCRRVAARHALYEIWTKLCLRGAA